MLCPFPTAWSNNFGNTSIGVVDRYFMMSTLPDFRNNRSSLLIGSKFAPRPENSVSRRFAAGVVARVCCMYTGYALEAIGRR